MDGAGHHHIGLLMDNWWLYFCTGGCVATCTRFGMTVGGAVCDGSLLADVFVNAIPYQWYCMGIWQGCGRLDWLVIQCQTCHG